MARRTIFSDIGGTHVFHRKLEDPSQPVEQVPDFGGRTAYYSSDLRALVEDLRQTWDVRLVTGRNLPTFQYLKDVIPYDSVALENGCVVLNRDGKIDREWYRTIEDIVGPLQDDGVTSSHDPRYPLWQLKDYLEDSGFVVQWQDCIASICVRAQDHNIPVRALYQIVNDHYRKEAEFAAIVCDYHGDFIDFYPQSAEKGSYLLFEAKRQGLEIQRTGGLARIKGTIGMGNDRNDLSMLSLVEFPMTLASAHEDIVAYTLVRSGFLAHASSYAGSRQMLRYVLRNLSHFNATP